MKLAIIVMFIGGGSGSNGGGNTYSPDGFNLPDSGAVDSFSGFLEGFVNMIPTDPGSGLIIGMIILIFGIALFFVYVSSVMEFVFVESLVSNDVRFWEYSRMYLRKGMGLFAFRLLVGVILLVVVVALALPFVLPLLGNSGENVLDVIQDRALILIVELIVIILIVAIIGAIINSFVNLSIPVAIYGKTGIFRAFSNVIGNFRKDWQQILVYWVGRFFLGLAVGIAVVIILLVTIIAAGIFMLLVDVLLYFVLSTLLSGPDTFVWLILVPVIILQVIVFLLLISFVAMPARVFMKYHMLTFLQQWYPDTKIPVFDMQGIDMKEKSVAED